MGGVPAPRPFGLLDRIHYAGPVVVEYEVIGRCPLCGTMARLMDEDEPIPVHRAGAARPCPYNGVAETVRRTPVKRPKQTSNPHPEAKTLSGKQKKRIRKAEIAKIIREGNQRLYGANRERRSTSVRTVSGGLPTLGK